jgi:hypothetical protein
MVAEASNSEDDDGLGQPEGLSKLDASLLRHVAEIAAQKEHSPELQRLPRP